MIGFRYKIWPVFDYLGTWFNYKQQLLLFRNGCVLNRTEHNFYFRTYTKYIVTIQFCHVWYMLHNDNSYACLRDNKSVCIFIKENNKTHTHTHTHACIRTHARAHTHIWYRYTCLAFSKLYSFVKSNIRQNVYLETNTHILSGYRYWSMNKKR